MALRIAASGNNLTRTANVPSTAAVTVCGWAMPYTDIGSVFQTLVSLEGGGSYFTIVWEGGTANTARIERTGGTGVNFGSRPALNTPFFWAITGDATNMIGYWRDAASTAFVTVSQSTVTFAPTNLYLGNSGASEWLDGQFFAVKCWDRALSARDLLAESYSYKPLNATNLNFWWPLVKDTSDYSANRRNATITGTPRLEQPTWFLPPPRRKRRILRAAASGTTYNESLTEAASASDALATVLAALNSLAEAGSASDAGTSVLTGNNTLSEAGAAADSLTHSALVGNGLTEAGAASDSGANTLTTVDAAAEVANAQDSLADSVTSGATYNDTLTESGTASDAPTSQLTAQNALTEAGAASDAENAPGSIYGASLSEAANATDALTDSLAGAGGAGGSDRIIRRRRRTH